MKGILKKIIIFVVLFIICVVAWNIVSGGKKDEQTLTSTAGYGNLSLLGEGESQVADEFLNTLLNLNTITLSGDVFSDPRFTSLEDYTVELTPQPLGRTNPFIPVGALGTTTGAVTTATTTSTVSTATATSTTLDE